MSSLESCGVSCSLAPCHGPALSGGLGVPEKQTRYVVGPGQARILSPPLECVAASAAAKDLFAVQSDRVAASAESAESRGQSGVLPAERADLVTDKAAIPPHSQG